MERARKREERFRWQRKQYRVHRERKQKSNNNPGWQDRKNMTDINYKIKVYIKCKF